MYVYAVYVCVCTQYLCVKVCFALLSAAGGGLLFREAFKWKESLLYNVIRKYHLLL